MTAPQDDTTEGLRERLTEKLTRMCSHFADDPECAEMTADAVLAALAGVSGDLPAQMAEAIAEKFTPQSAVYGEDREYRDATLAERADKGALAVFFTAGDGHRSFRSPTAREVAEVAASVCWEHAASQTAEVERLRTALAATRSDVDAMQREVHRHVLANAEQQGKVERLRAELAEEKVDNKGLRDRLYYANADATRAEAERDALKAAIETGDVARFAADVHRLVADYSNEERGVIALMPFEATLDQLCLEKYGFDLEKVAALDAPETPRDAETEDSDG